MIGDGKVEKFFGGMGFDSWKNEKVEIIFILSSCLHVTDCR